MGFYRAVIASLDDPLKIGRARLKIPQLFGADVTNWAMPLLPPSPELKIGDQVWASFEGDDRTHPVYLPLVLASVAISPTTPTETELALLSGTTAPTLAVGTLGDFFMKYDLSNPTNWRMYGPKTASGWGAGIAIQGPAGAAGATGPAGAPGSAGPTGATGANGTNGVGVPAGGTTGQYLVKNSATNYDTTWSTLSLVAGSGGPGPQWVAASDANATLKSLIIAAGGSVCDGTADQAEINTALATHKSIFLTSGTYNISAPITPVSGNTILGAGNQATILRAATGLTVAIFSITGAKDHITIRDLGLNGNGVGTVDGINADITASTGFTTGADACMVFENIVMRNITGTGLSMTGNNNRDSKISKLHIWNAVGKGVYINCPDGSLDTVITGTCGPTGIQLDTGSSNWRVSNCKSWFSEGDGFWIAGARNRLDGCEAQDNAMAGLRITGSLIAVNGFTADSNSYNGASNTNANVHSGVEIGRTSTGTTSGGFDITMTNVQSWDKNESSRGFAQRSGIRVRSGARGICIIGFNTGNPSATTPHKNVTAGIEFDTPADQTNAANKILGINHWVAI